MSRHSSVSGAAPSRRASETPSGRMPNLVGIKGARSGSIASSTSAVSSSFSRSSRFQEGSVAQGDSGSSCAEALDNFIDAGVAGFERVKSVISAANREEVLNFMERFELSSHWKHFPLLCESRESIVVQPSGKASSLLEMQRALDNPNKHLDDTTQALLARLGVSTDQLSWPYQYKKGGPVLRYAVPGPESGSWDTVIAIGFKPRPMAPWSVRFSMQRRRKATLPKAIPTALGLSPKGNSHWTVTLASWELVTSVRNKEGGFGALSSMLSRAIPDAASFHREISSAVQQVMGLGVAFQGIPTSIASDKRAGIGHDVISKRTNYYRPFSFSKRATISGPFSWQQKPLREWEYPLDESKIEREITVAQRLQIKHDSYVEALSCHIGNDDRHIARRYMLDVESRSGKVSREWTEHFRLGAW